MSSIPSNEFDHVIIDGSYNMSIQDGRLLHIDGLAMNGHRRRVKVVVTNLIDLPTDESWPWRISSCGRNDTICVDEKGIVIFTKKEFVRKIGYVVHKARFDTYEEAKKHGNPILQDNLDLVW